MKARWAFGSVASGAAYSLVPPLSALLVLKPTEYGLFSAGYLLFAFGVSLQYSVVSEVWIRTESPSSERQGWQSYSSALIPVSMFVGLLASVLLVFFPDSAVGLGLVALGAAGGTFRSGSRYFTVAEQRYARAFTSDVFGLSAFGIALVLLHGSDEFIQLAGSWACMTLAALCSLQAPHFSLREAREWFVTKRQTIKHLLADSVLLDLSSIGVPYLLLGRLGLTDFGVYRAVSSAAVPVRLILDPLRPTIGRRAPADVTNARFAGLATGTAGMLGLLVWGGLTLTPTVSWLDTSTLVALASFAVPAGVYTVLSFMTVIFYTNCRANATARRILVARVIQTAGSIAFPLLGVVTYGLDGAIWAYVVAEAIAMITWFATAIRSRR